jgi:mRNA interferase YafQ
LPRELNDHPLKGPWNGYRDVHIESDWVLIYKADVANLWLVRTGSHADLFGT